MISCSGANPIRLPTCHTSPSSCNARGEETRSSHQECLHEFRVLDSATSLPEADNDMRFVIEIAQLIWESRHIFCVNPSDRSVLGEWSAGIHASIIQASPSFVSCDFIRYLVLSKARWCCRMTCLSASLLSTGTMEGCTGRDHFGLVFMRTKIGKKTKQMSPMSTNTHNLDDNLDPALEI